MRTLLPILTLLLAPALAGCLGGPGGPDALDAGGEGDAAPAAMPRVHEVKGAVTLVGAPDPVTGSAGFGAGLSAVKTELRIPEEAARIVVEVEWHATTPFRVAAQLDEEREDAVYVSETPAHVASGQGGDPGHARLVVDDPEPGLWDLEVWPDGVAHEVQATMRYVVLPDHRDVALF